MHQDVNQQIVGTADEINDLLDEIADLNLQIVVGRRRRHVSPSDAVGLRDQRAIALAELAEIIDIRTIEQPTGDVTVFSGGDSLSTWAFTATVDGRPRRPKTACESPRSQITDIDYAADRPAAASWPG